MWKLGITVFCLVMSCGLIYVLYAHAEPISTTREPKTVEQRVRALEGQANLNSEKIAQLGDEMDANFIVRDELLAHLVERIDKLKNNLDKLIITIQAWRDYFLGQDTKKKKG